MILWVEDHTSVYYTSKDVWTEYTRSYLPSFGRQSVCLGKFCCYWANAIGLRIKQAWLWHIEPSFSGVLEADRHTRRVSISKALYLQTFCKSHLKIAICRDYLPDTFSLPRPWKDWGRFSRFALKLSIILIACYSFKYLCMLFISKYLPLLWSEYLS